MIFTMHTMHGSSTNRTDSWRLSVDFRVQPSHAPPTLVSPNKGRQSMAERQMRFESAAREPGQVVSAPSQPIGVSA